MSAVGEGAMRGGGGLSPGALEALRAAGEPVRLGVGETLVNEGDHGEAVFLVERGLLVATRAAAPGEGDAVLGWVGAGDLVGELAVLCGAARCATVTARTEALAWRVEGARFVALLEADPSLALALARSIAGRARGGGAPAAPGRQATLTLYVPQGRPGSDSVLARSRRFLAELFGGATMLPARGTWRSEAEGLVDDELCLLRVFADARDVARNLPRVREHARQVRRALGEEAVAFELDGRLELV